MGLSLMLTSFSRIVCVGEMKRAADVLIFDKADAVGDAGLARVADGCIKAGIRHADDDVRLHGMLEREERACALARHVDAAAVDHGVGAGEVDELEDAQPLRRFAAVGSCRSVTPFLSDDDDLARAECRAQSSAPTASSAQDSEANTTLPSFSLPHAEGTEAVGVAGGDELAWGTR